MLTEDGTAREWTDAAPSPRAGPCAAPGGCRFPAVGIRAGVATRTEPVSLRSSTEGGYVAIGCGGAIVAGYGCQPASRSSLAIRSRASRTCG